MALLWDFAREIGVGNPGNTTSYLDEAIQAFYTNSNTIATKESSINMGAWEDSVYGDQIAISDTGYSSLDIEHQFNDIVFGSAYSNGNVVLLLYEYRASPVNLYTNGQLQLQPGNAIKNASLDLTSASRSRLEDSAYNLFKPNSILTLKYRLDENEPELIGRFVVHSSIYNEMKQTVTLKAQNDLGNKVIRKTFDDNGSYTGTVTEVIEDILEDAGITNYLVETNSATGDHAFEPEQSYFDGLTEYCNNLGWYIDDTRDGQVVIGSETFVKTTIPATTHTFIRNTEVVSRGMNIDSGEFYTRVCIRRKGTTPLYVYGNVPMNTARGIPSESTYYRDVYDDIAQADMEDLRDQLIENLKYRGISEIFTTGFRPWIQIGDGCIIESGGSSIDISGVITDVYHAFGNDGYYTQFVVSEGGSMSNPTTSPTLVSKYVPRTINRNQIIRDYINNPNK